MSRSLRIAALHLALAAMVLRALLPAGWMPDRNGGAALTLCTMDGPVHPAPGKAPDDGHAHDACPFAAAPHLASAPGIESAAAPGLRLEVAARDAGRAAAPATARFTPQSPRAPPAIA